MHQISKSLKRPEKSRKIIQLDLPITFSKEGTGLVFSTKISLAFVTFDKEFSGKIKRLIRSSPENYESKNLQLVPLLMIYLDV